MSERAIEAAKVAIYKTLCNAGERCSCVEQNFQWRDGFCDRIINIAPACALAALAAAERVAVEDKLERKKVEALLWKHFPGNMVRMTSPEQEIWLDIFMRDLDAQRVAGEDDDERTLRHAFRNVDDLDWQHLYKFIPYSGHGQFWMAVFDEARAAIAKATGTTDTHRDSVNEQRAEGK